MLSPRTMQVGAVSPPVPSQRGSLRERGGEERLVRVWDVFHPVKIETELDTEKS